MFSLKYIAKHLFLLFMWISSLEGLNPELLYSKMKEPTPEWMLKQIQHDLAPFTTELSRQSLDALFAREELALFRVQIINGYLTVKKSQRSKNHSVPDQVIAPLMLLHALKALPDLDLVFSAHDTLEWLPKGPDLPIFIITKYKQDTRCILFPDWYALRGFEPEKSQILQGNSMYPWESKSKMLFFRGGDSGIFDKSRWMSYPRPRLMGLAVQYPHLIDAKFTHLFHTEHSEFVNRSGYMGNFVTMQDHPRYRYLLDLDGNCAATPRFPLLLHSNSVILKNMTDSILWFYGTIKPYVHFIPVAEDLSDMFTQLEWARTHDEECRKISENARQLAADVLMEESVYLYFYRLLEAYSNRQKAYY